MMISMNQQRSASKSMTRNYGKSSKSVKTRYIPPTHPAYVIATSFSAPHILELKDSFQQNGIAYGMQTGKKKLCKPPNAKLDKVFLVVDNSAGPVNLIGEFLTLNYHRVDFPVGNSISSVIKSFDSYIGLGRNEEEIIQEGMEGEENRGQSSYARRKTVIRRKQTISNYQSVVNDQSSADRGNGQGMGQIALQSMMNRSEMQKQGNMNQQNNRVVSSEVRRVHLKSVQKYSNVQKTVTEHHQTRIEKRVLFIYVTEYEKEYYQRYTRKYSHVVNKRIITITSLEQYWQMCYGHQEGYNYLLVGENAAKMELYRFRNLKQVFLLAEDPKQCSRLVGANVNAGMVSQKQMDALIRQKNFDPDAQCDFIPPERVQKQKEQQAEKKMKLKAAGGNSDQRQGSPEKKGLLQKLVGLVKGRPKTPVNLERKSSIGSPKQTEDLISLSKMLKKNDNQKEKEKYAKKPQSSNEKLEKINQNHSNLSKQQDSPKRVGTMRRESNQLGGNSCPIGIDPNLGKKDKDRTERLSESQLGLSSQISSNVNKNKKKNKGKQNQNKKPSIDITKRGSQLADKGKKKDTKFPKKNLVTFNPQLKKSVSDYSDKKQVRNSLSSSSSSSKSSSSSDSGVKEKNKKNKNRREKDRQKQVGKEKDKKGQNKGTQKDDKKKCRQKDKQDNGRKGKEKEKDKEKERKSGLKGDRKQKKLGKQNGDKDLKKLELKKENMKYHPNHSKKQKGNNKDGKLKIGEPNDQKPTKSGLQFAPRRPSDKKMEIQFLGTIPQYPKQLSHSNSSSSQSQDQSDLENNGKQHLGQDSEEQHSSMEGNFDNFIPIKLQDQHKDSQTSQSQSSEEQVQFFDINDTRQGISSRDLGNQKKGGSEDLLQNNSQYDEIGINSQKNNISFPQAKINDFAKKPFLNPDAQVDQRIPSFNNANRPTLPRTQKPTRNHPSNLMISKQDDSQSIDTQLGNILFKGKLDQNPPPFMDMVNGVNFPTPSMAMQMNPPSKPQKRKRTDTPDFSRQKAPIINQNQLGNDEVIRGLENPKHVPIELMNGQGGGVQNPKKVPIQLMSRHEDEEEDEIYFQSSKYQTERSQSFIKMTNNNIEKSMLSVEANFNTEGIHHIDPAKEEKPIKNKKKTLKALPGAPAQKRQSQKSNQSILSLAPSHNDGLIAPPNGKPAVPPHNDRSVAQNRNANQNYPKTGNHQYSQQNQEQINIIESLQQIVIKDKRYPNYGPAKGKQNKKNKNYDPSNDNQNGKLRLGLKPQQDQLDAQKNNQNKKAHLGLRPKQDQFDPSTDKQNVKARLGLGPKQDEFPYKKLDDIQNDIKKIMDQLKPRDQRPLRTHNTVQHYEENVEITHHDEIGKIIANHPAKRQLGKSAKIVPNQRKPQLSRLDGNNENLRNPKNYGKNDIGHNERPRKNQFSPHRQLTQQNYDRIVENGVVIWRPKPAPKQAPLHNPVSLRSHDPSVPLVLAHPNSSIHPQLDLKGSMIPNYSTMPPLSSNPPRIGQSPSDPVFSGGQNNPNVDPYFPQYSNPLSSNGHPYELSSLPLDTNQKFRNPLNINPNPHSIPNHVNQQPSKNNPIQSNNPFNTFPSPSRLLNYPKSNDQQQPTKNNPLQPNNPFSTFPNPSQLLNYPKYNDQNNPLQQPYDNVKNPYAPRNNHPKNKQKPHSNNPMQHQFLSQDSQNDQYPRKKSNSPFQSPFNPNSHPNLVNRKHTQKLNTQYSKKQTIFQEDLLQREPLQNQRRPYPHGKNGVNQQYFPRRNRDRTKINPRQDSSRSPTQKKKNNRNHSPAFSNQTNDPFNPSMKNPLKKRNSNEKSPKHNFPISPRPHRNLSYHNDGPSHRMPRFPSNNPSYSGNQGQNNKNHSILYLINMNRSGKLLSQIHSKCTPFDSLQTYTSSQKMKEMVAKSDEIFDYVVVIGANNDGDYIQPVLEQNSNKIKYIGPDPDHQNGSPNQQLPDINQLIKEIDNDFNKKNKKKPDNPDKVKTVYYKDFNKNIMKIAQSLTQTFPGSEARKYFGVNDLPTMMPKENDQVVVLLLDEVGYDDTRRYIQLQQRIGVKLVKICIPKADESISLCKGQSSADQMLWFTSSETSDPQYLSSRIKSMVDQL